MPSRSSSGTVMPNSSSRAITSSTRSRLSASRSSAKRASGTTLSSGTDSTSTAHFRNRPNSSSSTGCSLFGMGSSRLVAHAEAPVDGEHGPRDVGGVGRGQERNGTGHLVGGAEATERDPLGHLRLEVVGQDGGHVGG